eukprot:g27942.t1
MVRRFRPGLDYTVAARGAQDSDEADLDAILCFALGGSKDELQTAASEQWASEEVGGFECYLAADEARTHTTSLTHLWCDKVDIQEVDVIPRQLSLVVGMSDMAANFLRIDRQGHRRHIKDPAASLVFAL